MLLTLIGFQLLHGYRVQEAERLIQRETVDRAVGKGAT